MVATAPTALMTVEEFTEWSNLPENAETLYELDSGKAVPMASPGELHALVCWYVVTLLTSYLKSHGSGYLLTKDGGQLLSRLYRTIRGPDIALYLQDLDLSDARPSHSERCPTLVVEIRSPSDRDARLLRRIRDYLNNGVLQAWVVDPEDLAVTVYQQDQFPEILEGADVLKGGTVLPNFQCAITEFFVMPFRRVTSPI
jgi:Uma2 family endonuclease